MEQEAGEVELYSSVVLVIRKQMEQMASVAGC
jgi:hypothetical protein